MDPGADLSPPSPTADDGPADRGRGLSDVDIPSGPDVDVVPPDIQFGPVPLLRPATKSLTVVNAGGQVLHIFEAEADARGTQAYALLDDVPQTLSPGETATLRLQFEPRGSGRVESRLHLRTNDPDEPTYVVRLAGEGVELPPCEVQVGPEVIDFGLVQRMKSAVRAIEIWNLSPFRCLLTGVRRGKLDEPAFSLGGEEGPGEIRMMLLEPGSALATAVVFTPPEPGIYRATLEVYTGVVELRGRSL